MYLELDGQGSNYSQLIRALKTAILDGRIKSGSRLPASRILGQDLGMARNTVIATYEQLAAEGFVVSRIGSGTFVADVKAPLRLAQPVQRISPQTRYAKRARNTLNLTVAERHFGLRYDLSGYEPLVEPVVMRAWARELARAAVRVSTGYPGAMGLPDLRAAVCEYLGRRRGVATEPDNVMIVHGTQQALNLVALVLLNSGDGVVMEEPHYFSAHEILRAYGVKIESVPTDADGLVCDLLPDEPARLICVTPSHQYPGGSVLSLSRRLELLRYAGEHRCWIFEDDYDSEFRYSSRPLAALRSLDRGDRVIYVGTFSKVLFPALRLGYMVMPAALREDLIRAKWLADLGCGAIEQAAMASFIRNGGFDRHLQRAGKALKARRTALLKGLKRFAGDRVEIADGRAGMHLIVWLRDFTHAQAEDLINLAHERDLGIYPLAPYYSNPPETPGLILGYAGHTTVELTDATEVFGRCLDEICFRSRT